MSGTVESKFEALGLDYRVLRGIEKKRISVPTQVQAAVIPAALEGKDITAWAHTGTGKTLAYLAPAVHRLLQSGDSNPEFSVVVLVPTSELCEQVKNVATTLAVHCAANIRATVLAGDSNKQSKKISISSAGQIVTATPGRLAKALQDGSLKAADLATNLKMLVLDEADLLLSYGYEADLKALIALVPRAAQRMLMSATASEEISHLASLLLHEPATFDLTSASHTAPVQAPSITHTYVEVQSEAYRLLTVLALLRLGLVAKKVLLFVNSPDAAYRVRLFLEAFGIKAGTLVATLPLASRQRAIEQFNAGAFDILVAAEASTSDADEHDDDEDDGGERSAQASAEYGVTRGVDFKGVRTVVNVENPASLSKYTHRVGRTGRAGAQGFAISLVGPKDSEFLQMLRQSMPEIPGEAEEGLQQFHRLKKEGVEALRYRGEDVLKSLTKRAVRQARARDLKLEVLNCSKLQEFFETHESDARALKNDKQLTKHIHKVKHLRQMPDYLKVAAGVAKGSSQRRVQHARGVKRKLKPEDDPLKGASKFSRDTEATEMEVKALKIAKKQAKKQAKNVVPVVKKTNVRKRR